MSDINILIAGAAGQGVESAAAILEKTLLRLGFHVYTTRDYQSRVRGGHNFMQIRFSNCQLDASVRRINFLVALNEESLRIHAPDLIENGLALSMETHGGNFPGVRIRTLSADVGPKTARGPKFTAVKLLAMLFTLLGFKPETLKGAVEIQFGKRLTPELLQANLDAIDAVSAHVESKDIQPIPFTPTDISGWMHLDGNTAISLGMVAAGIGFYAGYPMTPSTSILNNLAAWGPQVGIAVEQTEDEIAALNAAIGAAYAGARAATGSSGAGMCLMSEAMGLAGITETPVVIVDAQRAGPSTGMATRTEQSDLLFVVNASHGEFPRAVIAPATTEDGFYMAAEAFNIAEKWHIPVFLMGDMAHAGSGCTVPDFDLSKISINRGPIAPEPESPAVLPRYKITESGVSPRAYPCRSRWIVACDSHEHDELGHLTDDPENRMAQLDKRMRKLSGMAETFEGPEIIGGPAETLLICWGSTTGPVREAAKMLQDEGMNVAVGIFRWLYPMNVEKVKRALAGFKRIFSVEGNATGQLGKLLQMETCIKPTGHIGKADGRLFTVEDVYGRVKTVLGGNP